LMKTSQGIFARMWWWILATIVGIALTGPFVIMVAAGCQKSRSVFSGPWAWFPTNPTWINSEIIVTRSSVIRWTLNSFIISTIPVAGSIFFSLTLGYIFARKPFPGRELIFWMLLASIMIPFQVTLVPLYLMMNEIGWIDTYQVLIFPSML